MGGNKNSTYDRSIAKDAVMPINAIFLVLACLFFTFYLVLPLCYNVRLILAFGVYLNDYLIRQTDDTFAVTAYRAVG